MAKCAECGQIFRTSSGEPSIEKLKKHMAENHGGYTAEQISNSDEDSASEPNAPPVQPDEVIPPGEPETRERPRRASRANRELNDKLNEVLELQIRHLLGVQLSADQQKTLADNRAEVRNALIGFEFNFDDRVIKLESGFWRILITILLVIAPFVPTLPEVKAKASAAQKAAQGKQPETKKPEAAKPAAQPAAQPEPESPAPDAVDEGTAFR